MIHEIFPHRLYNEFREQTPRLTDYLVVCNGREFLFKKTESDCVIPTVSDISTGFFYGQDCSKIPCHYLLSIDDRAYFLADFDIQILMTEQGLKTGFEFRSFRTFRELKNPLDRLGGATSAHIAEWEMQNRFCGKCGSPMVRGTRERSLVCTSCKNTVYPRISPVVIVAVHDGDKLLMARNLDNPNKKLLFLISGFVEIGESLEQAALREVLEETGVRIKNLKYFGSQPWPFSESLIAGFNAELDGDGTLRIQETEIEKACWVNRKDIPPYDTSVSISCALIENFRIGNSNL